MSIPPTERLRLRSFGDAAPGLARVLDELERVERNCDEISATLRETCAILGAKSFAETDGNPEGAADAARRVMAELQAERDEHGECIIDRDIARTSCSGIESELAAQAIATVRLLDEARRARDEAIETNHDQAWNEAWSELGAILGQHDEEPLDDCARRVMAEMVRERACLVERIDELERLYAAIGGKE